MAKVTKIELQIINTIREAIAKIRAYTDKNIEYIRVSREQWKRLNEIMNKWRDNKELYYPGIVFYRNGKIEIDGMIILPIIHMDEQP